MRLGLWGLFAAACLAVALLAVPACLAVERVLGSSPKLSPPAALDILAVRYAGDEARAAALADAAVVRDPASPDARLVRMKLAWWTLLEGPDSLGTVEQGLRSDLEALRRSAMQRLEADPQDAQAAWILGEGHCTVGRWAGLSGRTWEAFRQHQQGVRWLETAARLRPDAPEPRASLGLFRYYAARLPLSLRVVGRLVRVRGDRETGLADLRLAAGAAGLQQAEAAFFLVEVLNHMEDENLEALEHAALWHARWPACLGFRLKLADVLVGLECPGAALDVLHPSGAEDDGRRAQLALLRARILVDTGRPLAARSILDGLSPAAIAAGGWTASWEPVERAACLALLGDRAGASSWLERARRMPDAAGSHAAAAALEERLESPFERARAAAESVLCWDGDPGPARAALERAGRNATAERLPAPVAYSLGRLRLLEGDAAGAAPCFERAAAGSGDEAWLTVRSRVRLLQSLVWAGRIDAARAAAAELAPRLGAWGTNRQLAALVHGILEPGGPQLEPFVGQRQGEQTAFRLRDAGFTSVRLTFAAGGRSLPGSVGIPMSLDGPYWRADVALPPGTHLYAFRVEETLFVLDPCAAAPIARDGRLWSARDIARAS